ncbi:MAG TPA: MBL fold metallo-hydrolase [Solirubrobacteraceae bacterium]|jgi:glyoxylase-like metal-dependent hydrolase (beta-lactamase superfamily II)|nr:MBL fold metallo-hydrolase [Solirubrobacteraceae bacterium]
MILERSMRNDFLTNQYLVADGEGGPAFFVDAGGPSAPLIARARELELRPTHVLLTHHHGDHVSDLGTLLEQWPDLEVLIHPLERELVPGVTGTIEAGQRTAFGALEVRPLHTPGHTAGMLSFLVGRPGPSGSRGGASGPGGFSGAGAVVFTGDTLFRGSVGGVRAPGSTSYTDLRDAIMGTLMELPRDTPVYPGHTDSTTVGAEWEGNRFIRIWRGLDPEGSEPCTALGEPATLILLGDDYDGGHKAWVRWPDGRDDIVPGSRVERA